ncbi:MAG: glycosyltransferase family 2 protein [Gloeobacteraceae cyanobacterium ES-bin-316]|nr:glycosyltransferase family 2 protein [Ferruginibacter sp.]
MLTLKFLLWTSAITIFYSYLGYGCILWAYLKIIKAFKKPQDSKPRTFFEPEISLVIAAYNEEDIIEEKIKNCLQLDYPAEKLQIIFVADGSTDSTTEIISRYSRVKLLYKPERKGKVAAINRAMSFVTTPFVVFCDANTILNEACIKEIVNHYSDEKIGAVAGEKKIISHTNSSDAASAGEGLYWKYESILKKLDAEFYTVVGAAGELFSVRTHLFDPVPEGILLDDFMISMKICIKGYRVMYEPKAFASETSSFSMKEEQKRKIRISAGGFQSVLQLKKLLNIFKYGKLSFQYISHRVLRWIVCPVMLPLLFTSSLFLYYYTNEFWYLLLLCLQLLFYMAATAGFIFASKNIKIKALYIPYYFVFMNAALYLGFVKFLNNQQSVLWEKAKRK